jgi:hypothetical protein
MIDEPITSSASAKGAGDLIQELYEEYLEESMHEGTEATVRDFGLWVYHQGSFDDEHSFPDLPPEWRRALLWSIIVACVIILVRIVV